MESSTTPDGVNLEHQTIHRPHMIDSTPSSVVPSAVAGMPSLPEITTTKASGRSGQVAPSEAHLHHASADRTAVPPLAHARDGVADYDDDASATAFSKADDIRRFAPIEPARTADSIDGLPATRRTASGREIIDDQISKILSKRRTNKDDDGITHREELAEIERLMSRMFGRDRQAQSEDEQTRHVGLSFKSLTVKGMGLGAALQPSVGDILLGLPRLIQGLVTRRRGVVGTGKPPVRTLLDDFSGCVRPGEMLLVLGRPGSGCSTFLKVLGNQRFGYVDIGGEVTYGGTSAADMMKNYRGEVLYNPEEDLHYATLTVRDTLTFALTTRTPDKRSRQPGESRLDYVREFLRVVAKLFWIEHTMTTKVGDAFFRGVSGGEKKRVSIAEAMITKASTQCWDNSTRGLDASTALEYVESLRTLTNMAHVSTLVALYQAGESLYELFDKVVLIHEGRCAYYGPATEAKAYFEALGFHCPPRCTTAEFLTSVVDRHEREIRPGWEDRFPRTGEAFQKAYMASDAYRRNLADVDDLDNELARQKHERESNHVPLPRKKNYTIPFHKQVLACTHRQFLVMFGDSISLFGKWGGIVFQALIVGSLFYKLPNTAAGVFARGGWFLL